MARKRYKAEEIIAHLREVEVRLSQGETIAIACLSSFKLRHYQSLRRLAIRRTFNTELPLLRVRSLAFIRLNSRR